MRVYVSYFPLHRRALLPFADAAAIEINLSLLISSVRPCKFCVEHVPWI